MSTSQTSTSDEAGPTWRQLGETDFGAIGFATGVNVAAALLLAHVVWEASWPPYATIIPRIVVFSGLAVSCRVSHPPYVQGEQRVGCGVCAKGYWPLPVCVCRVGCIYLCSSPHYAAVGYRICAAPRNVAYYYCCTCECMCLGVSRQKKKSIKTIGPHNKHRFQ